MVDDPQGSPDEAPLLHAVTRRWQILIGQVPPAPMSPTVGLLGVLGMLFGSFLWMCAGGIVVAIALIASVGLPEGPSPSVETLPTAVLAAGTWLQFAGFLGIVVVLSFVCARSARDAFALRGAGARGLGAAVLGGLTVGLFPSWVAERLMALLPSLDGGMLTQINGMLAQGPLPGRVLMLGAVVIGAPVVEELMFRGFLWEAMRAIGGDLVAWLGTSALFAMYHVDPVHVIAVSITGLYLGWLRRVTGSIVPCMLAHFVNNALAAGVALAFGPAIGEATTPMWVALLGGLATLGIALAAGTADADRLRTGVAA